MKQRSIVNMRSPTSSMFRNRMFTDRVRPPDCCCNNRSEAEECRARRRTSSKWVLREMMDFSYFRQQWQPATAFIRNDIIKGSKYRIHTLNKYDLVLINLRKPFVLKMQSSPLCEEVLCFIILSHYNNGFGFCGA